MVQFRIRAAGFVLPAVFLAGVALGAPVPSVVGEFDGLRAWRADSVLASPAFEGRRSGTAGGLAAETWIASVFAAAGLRPVGEEGGYLQGFPVIGYEPSAAHLELLDGPLGKIPFVDGDDFTLLLTPAAGRVTAEAVMVGYGIDAPAKGRNDYAGCDLHGRIAVILRGRPEDGQNWDREFMRTHTFAAARAHGAAAVLYFQGATPVSGAALAPECYDAATPAGYVGERIVHLLLRDTGWTLEEVQEKLKSGPFPLATGKRLRFDVAVDGPATATGHNVLGMLDGADSVLSREVVILGAHHDHIGRDAEGRVFPGADDNGSGASEVVEMVRAIHASGWRPRRSILFATFGGEESGLLGSRALASSLPFDSTRAVAMLNLDMAGEGDGGLGVAGGARLGKPYLAWRAALDSSRAAGLEEYRLSGEHSDYAPFAAHGIPALGCWSRGAHTRYHDIEDLPRYVRPDVLQSVGRDLASLLVEIADYPEPLADGLGRERGLRADAVQLSLSPRSTDELVDPDRRILGGEGRLAGSLIQCGEAGAGTDEILRRIGSVLDLPAGRPWLVASSSLGRIGEARDESRVALMPVLSTGALERLGPASVDALCAAGLGAAYWDHGTGPPSSPLCDALARRKCLIIDDGNPGWTETIAPRPDLRVLLGWGGANPGVPDPPDSTLRSRVLLGLTITGVGDSATVRAAVAKWGDRHVHVDLSSGLEADRDDRGSLQFIAWLRGAVPAESSVEALLGGNLRRF